MHTKNADKGSIIVSSHKKTQSIALNLAPTSNLALIIHQAISKLVKFTILSFVQQALTTNK